MKRGPLLGLALVGLAGVGIIAGGVAVAISMVPAGRSPVESIAAHHGISHDLAAGIVDVARDVGTRPDWLAALIDFETDGTFSPSVRNPDSTATGILQFTEPTAERLGTSTAELAAMTALEQLAYARDYLQRVSRGEWPDDSRAAPLDTLGRLAFSVFWLPGRFLPMSTLLPEHLRLGNRIDQIGEYLEHIQDRMLPGGV